MVTVVKKGASIKVIEELLNKLKSKKALNARKHKGVIRLKESPLEIQKKLRDEWE